METSKKPHHQVREVTVIYERVRFRPSVPGNRSDTRSDKFERGKYSVQPTSAMVTRSRAQKGRGISIVPKIEFRPETETRPEPEIVMPAEIQVSMSAICEEGLGAAICLRYR